MFNHTLHDLLNLHFESSNFASVRIFQQSLQTMDAQSAVLNCCHVIILIALNQFNP